MRLDDGSVLEEVVRPLASAGLYVPGGRGAYPSSVLMGAIPARVAGVPRLVIVTPPRSLEQNPAVAAAIAVAGVGEHVYRVGGAQAVAALAYGTRTIPRVDKIVGPGNAFVAAAKRAVRGQVEIDTEAGPSEVVILADDSADAGFVAADLLAQAEHGSGDETVVLVTPSRALAAEVTRLVAEGRRLGRQPRAARGARWRATPPSFSCATWPRAQPRSTRSHPSTWRCWRAGRRVWRGGSWRAPSSSAPSRPWRSATTGSGPTTCCRRAGRPASPRRSPCATSSAARASSRSAARGLARVVEDVVRVAMAEGFRGHAQSVLTRFEGA